jgi:hypothetical protein
VNLAEDGRAGPFRASLRIEQAAGALVRSLRSHAHGSPLCQVAAGTRVVGWVLAGPGSDLSEEPVWECEPVTLELGDVSQCPPGPVTDLAIASSIMRR